MWSRGLESPPFGLGEHIVHFTRRIKRPRPGVYRSTVMAGWLSGHGPGTGPAGSRYTAGAVAMPDQRHQIPIPAGPAHRNPTTKGWGSVVPIASAASHLPSCSHPAGQRHGLGSGFGGSGGGGEEGRGGGKPLLEGGELASGCDVGWIMTVSRGEWGWGNYWILRYANRR